MSHSDRLKTRILEVLSSGPDYGYSICCEIKKRELKLLEYQEALLYPALHELELDDLVESSERTIGGKTRRYYRLTERGARVIEEAHQKDTVPTLSELNPKEA